MHVSLSDLMERTAVLRRMFMEHSGARDVLDSLLEEGSKGSSHRASMLIGSPFVGKTTLAHRVVDHWGNQGNKALWLSTSRDGSPEAFLHEMYRALRKPVPASVNLLDHTVRLLADAEIGVLVLDDLDRLAEGACAEEIFRLINLLLERTNVRLLAIGRPSAVSAVQGHLGHWMSTPVELWPLSMGELDTFRKHGRPFRYHLSFR